MNGRRENMIADRELKEKQVKFKYSYLKTKTTSMSHVRYGNFYFTDTVVHNVRFDFSFFFSSIIKEKKGRANERERKKERKW